MCSSTKKPYQTQTLMNTWQAGQEKNRCVIKNKLKKNATTKGTRKTSRGNTLANAFNFFIASSLILKMKIHFQSSDRLTRIEKECLASYCKKFNSFKKQRFQPDLPQIQLLIESVWQNMLFKHFR